MSKVYYNNIYSYTEHVRTILHHIKDKNNDDFRMKLFNSIIKYINRKNSFIFFTYIINR